MNKILWVDDEIELLKPHVLYLERKGFEMTTATNGYDAVKLVNEVDFDLVILDEMMIGMDGLETLEKIKDIDSDVKAIMLTKSEEEGIFLQAVGNMINDYLTKPVSPLQLYLTIRKNLEQENLVSENISKRYIKDYNILRGMIDSTNDPKDWIEINEKISYWGIKLDEINDPNLISTFSDLKSDANKIFGDFIQGNYENWINGEGDRPTFSVDIIDKYILPDINKEKLALIIIDCFPFDQMSVIEETLKNNFLIDKESYYSILPTSTEFARNAIFSGLFPDEIEKNHSDIYFDNFEDEESSNRNEDILLERQLRSKGFDLGKNLKYYKMYRVDEFAKFESKIGEMKDTKLLSIVVNMVDFLIHDKKKDELINEMMDSESSYRATIKNWFQSSHLHKIIDKLGDLGFKIIITTDHGAKLINKFTKIKGDGQSSSGLRMKYGKNLSTSNKKQTFFWQKPIDYKMTSFFKGKNIILAKEDHCFVYEKNLGDFFSKIKNTYQHGGISLDEVVLPVLILNKKQ
ncbi:MAG: bifunctional response regulator/alkaline phosphatase family protein [Candidatus Delongbacteria bacterium]|jgi:CheY-like chemotaxis protein|nr:bifunctional response regulator/alkaline phosphatase family protein [Candidatus Delongbacteria bacterium]